MSRRRGQGAPVTLGAKLGSGGEGAIYEAPSRPDLVAKMWTTPDEAKTRKLDALLQSKPSVPAQMASKVRLAWPQQPMYDKRRKTIGFAMPRASRDQYREFVAYSIPSARGRLEKELGVSIGERHLLGIARNVAEAFEIVHANGCLIGDVNHTNFLVSPDTSVFLIDVDSMQVTDKDTGEVYRCEVGTPDFTPPRLMGKRLPEIDRVPDDDYFGLATLIFQLLMEGSHPYDPVDSASSSGSGNARLENIKRGYSPYTAMLNAHARAWLTANEIPDPALRQRMRQDILAIIEGDSDTDYTALIDRRATAWLGLNPKLQELFRRAFPNDQATDSPHRPTPREWIEALEGAGAGAPSLPPPATGAQGPLNTPVASAPLYASTQTATLLWSQKIGYGIKSQPTPVDGVVYVGSDDKHVYAIDASDGALRWKYKTGGEIESSPDVVNGVVYVGSSDGYLYALDVIKIPRKRQRHWRFKTSGAVRSSPTVVDGVVYAGSSDRRVYAVNAANGEGIWIYETGGAVRSSPTVANGVVYVGSYDKNVYALDAATGDEIWKLPTGGRVESSPAVVDGVVYVGSNDNRVYALDAKTGRRLWSRGTGRAVRSSPKVADGVVYVGSSNKHMYALDAKTGRRVWRSPAGGGVWSAPTIAYGVVFVGPADGHVYALDAATGDVRWRYKVGDDAYLPAPSALSSRGLVNGVLYVGSDDGHVLALRVAESNGRALPSRRQPTSALIKPGGVLWRYGDGKNRFYSPKVVNGVLYVKSYDGYVYSLDAVAGTLRWKNEIGYSWITSNVVVEDSLVYSESDTNLRALDADTGELRWNYRADKPASLLVANGVLYASSGDNLVCALDVYTGDLKWSHEVDGLACLSSIAVVDATVYIGSFDKRICALDAHTGTPKWSYITDIPVSYLVVSDGMVYSDSKGVYALDAATGELKWKNPDVHMSSISVIVDGILHVGSHGHVVALNATTGSVWWSYDASDMSMFSIIATLKGVVYIRSYSGLIRAIDAVNGILKWEYQTVDKAESVSVVGSVAYVWAGSSMKTTLTIDDNLFYQSSEESCIYALNADTGDLIWKYETGEHSVDVASPAAVNDVMYMGSEDGYVYALNAGESNSTLSSSAPMMMAEQSRIAAPTPIAPSPSTPKPNGGSGPLPYIYVPEPAPVGNPGELLWRYDPNYFFSKTSDDFSMSTPVVASSPTIVGDALYSGLAASEDSSSDGGIYLLNIAGVYQESRTSGYNMNVVLSSPAVVDGVVYTGSNERYVRALDMRRNIEDDWDLWEYETGGEVMSSPAIMNGVVYVGSNDGRVYALNAATGRPRWTRATGGPVISSPAVVNGVVYVGSHDKNVYALDAANGKTLWKHKTGGWFRDGKVISSPAVADGVVYVGSHDKRLYALDAASGSRLWRYETGAEVASSPTVANGVVYVGSNDGYVYALDAASGDLTWRYETGGMVLSSPAVSSGVVYVGSLDGCAYALDATSGGLMWKYDVGSEIVSSPAVANGVVYVGSFDKHMYMHALAAGPSVRTGNRRS